MNTSMLNIAAASTLRQYFDQDAATRAMKTARSAGAVGASPVIFRSLIDNLETARIYSSRLDSLDILDFGCGAAQILVNKMREEFAPACVQGYDFALPGSEEWLDLTWDVVTVSNVLNVQDSVDMLDLTVKQLRQLAKAGAMIIANYPSSPRKIGLSIKAMRAALERRGLKVILEDRQGGTPVWYLEYAELPEVVLEIQRDLSWDEFRVAVYLDGIFQAGPTAHCGPDLQDARCDMECMQSHYLNAGHKVTVKGQVRKVTDERPAPRKLRGKVAA